MYTTLAEMWEGWTKNIYLGLRDHPSMILLGAFGASITLIAALFLPAWPVLGLLWWLNGGGWLAIGVIIKAMLVWGALLLARAVDDPRLSDALREAALKHLVPARA